MERKIISLPCAASVGGDSFVQVMRAEVSGVKNNLKLDMEVMNLHSRDLVALDYEIIFYNSILEKLNDDTYIISQKNFVVQSGTIGNIGKYFIPGEFSDARKADIILVRGFFEDGNALDLKYEHSEMILLEGLNEKNQKFLNQTAGYDANFLSQDNELSWRCVCGYFNGTKSEVCVNCEREKKEVLEKYSSIDIFDEDEDLSYETEEQEDDLENGEEPDIPDEDEEEDRSEKEKTVSKENKFKELLEKFKFLDIKAKILFAGSLALLLISVILWILK